MKSAIQVPDPDFVPHASQGCAQPLCSRMGFNVRCPVAVAKVRHGSRLLRVHLPVEYADKSLRNVTDNPAAAWRPGNQSRHAGPVKDNGGSH